MNRPGQMPALVATEHGPDFRLAPRPLASQGQAVLRVLCAGLCRTDLYAGTGLLAVAPGRILGHEFCAVVEKLGDGVGQALLGQRVAVFPWVGCGRCPACQVGIEGAARCAHRRMLGVDLDGAFASEVMVPADRLLVVPDTLKDRAAAYAEPVAAALGVEQVVPVGARMAVLGDNRLGVLACRLLELCGREVVADPAPDSLDYVLETSADTETIVRAMTFLKPGGTLVVKSRPAGLVGWPLRLQVEKELRVLGAGYGSLSCALTLLSDRNDLFSDLWEAPVPLTCWPEVFARESAGREQRKAFFVPEPLA